MCRDDHGSDRPSEPEPQDHSDTEADRPKKRSGLGRLPTRDVPEPPNRDEIRPDDDVTPDAGTIEPPD
ncbi:hypothetical protein [Saccharomonospora sp.]|uniref:hypothetical protein n=1 Tax=Saccharomonospora sp. TaxID=33913 RepID=UPI002622FD10|nr:hypothetical protein [Saccharomonospora sp.]